MRTHEENPWRRFGKCPEWELKVSADMDPGEYGYTDHSTKTVVIRAGMSFEERRSTIAHEIHHIYRGPVPDHKTLAEELLVDRCAARLLLPSMMDIADCLAWARGNLDEAAAELWVDPWMLEVRLSALHGRERSYMTKRQGDIWVVVDE